MDHIVASQTNSGHLEHSQAISATFKQFLDLGFWILDFGFLDFGFWILGFGFWIRAFLAIWKPPRPFRGSYPIGGSQTISGHLGASQTISGYFGAPCLGLKQPFKIWSNNNIKSKKP